MVSGEDYARKWAKQEKVEPCTLFDWVTSMSTLIRKIIFNLSMSMSSKIRSKGGVDNLT